MLCYGGGSELKCGVVVLFMSTRAIRGCREAEGNVVVARFTQSPEPAAL